MVPIRRTQLWPEYPTKMSAAEYTILSIACSKTLLELELAAHISLVYGLGQEECFSPIARTISLTFHAWLAIELLVLGFMPSTTCPSREEGGGFQPTGNDG
jgi:hypothetical protein